MTTTLNAARELMRDYPGRGAAMAQRLGKASDTLRHEVAGAPGYKLGIEDAVEMTLIAQESVHPNPLGVLNAFAADCGCMVINLPKAGAVDIGSCMAKFSQMAKEFSDLAVEISKDVPDGDVSDNDLKRILTEGDELISAWQVLRRALVQANQQSNDAAARFHLKAV